MTLYVINPNSTEEVTEGISKAVDPMRAWGHPVSCLTLTEGPPGMETDAHIREVVAPTLRLASGLQDATGFVVACFSDPGAAELRAMTAVPVIGIREAAVSEALTLGDKFGVIAIGEASVERHLKAFAAMGVSSRVAGDRPLGLSVTDLANERKTAERMAEVARTLVEQDCADVLILGCAGMARYRKRLERLVRRPVIDPCQVAVAMALGRITLQLAHQPETENA